MTSAHPRPSAPLAAASEPGYRSLPTPSSPVGAVTTAPNGAVPRSLLDRYRAGATVTALAQQFGVSFDWVAQRIIAEGARRDQLPQRRARRRPAELDSDEWLGVQLAGGAGVGDLSRRLHVTSSTVRNALRHYAYTARRTLRRGSGQYWSIRPAAALHGRNRPGRAGDHCAGTGTATAGFSGQRTAPVRAHDPRDRRPAQCRRVSRREPPRRRPAPRECMTPSGRVSRLGPPASQVDVGCAAAVSTDSPRGAWGDRGLLRGARSVQEYGVGGVSVVEPGPDLTR